MKKILFSIYIVAFAMLISCQSEQKQAQSEDAVKTISGELTYQVPEEWHQIMPSSSMRKAQFVLPGFENGGDGELAVFVFPGSGGSVQANIDRWIGQFKPSDEDNSVHQETNKIKVNGLDVTLVFARGTYMNSGMAMSGPVEELPDYALMAAIVETSGDPWFFKAVGPQATMDHWRDAFEKFATTVNEN